MFCVHLSPARLGASAVGEQAAASFPFACTSQATAAPTRPPSNVGSPIIDLSLIPIKLKSTGATVLFYVCSCKKSSLNNP